MVTSTRITNPLLIRELAFYTQHKPKPDSISPGTLAKYLKSEHSPIRSLIYRIELDVISDRVVSHLTRHKIGVEFYVKTSRPDWTSVESGSRSMIMIANAQALINIARKRLCTNAWHETRNAVEAIKQSLMAGDDFDKQMGLAMVPDCEYRNGCHEFRKCGRFKEVSN